MPRRIENAKRIDFSLPGAEAGDIVGLSISAGASVSVPVPADVEYILFGGEVAYRVVYDNTSNPSLGEVSPALRHVPEVDFVQVYSSEGGYVSLTFYK